MFKSLIISLIISSSSLCLADDFTATLEVLNCLQEARGESLEGKIAVYRTVYGRVESKRYPSSIEAVILAPKQFSWTNDVTYSMDVLTYTEKDLRECVRAKEIAKKRGPNKFLHYYAHNIVKPVWANNHTEKKIIGNHTFLRGVK